VATYAVVHQTGLGTLERGTVILAEPPELGSSFAWAGKLWSVVHVEPAEVPGYVAGTIHCRAVDDMP